jgi:hypothetical protein
MRYCLDAGTMLEPAAEVTLPEEIVAEQIYLRRMAIY